MPSPAERYLARTYAERIEKTDVAAFAWLLDLESSHDDEPETAKAMIVKALREYGRADRKD